MLLTEIERSTDSTKVDSSSQCLLQKWVISLGACQPTTLVYIYPSSYPPILSTYLPTFLCTTLFTYLSIFLSTYLPIYQLFYVPIYSPIYPSIYILIHLSTYLPTFLCTNLFTHLPNYECFKELTCHQAISTCQQQKTYLAFLQ